MFKSCEEKLELLQPRNTPSDKASSRNEVRALEEFKSVVNSHLKVCVQGARRGRGLMKQTAEWVVLVDRDRGMMRWRGLRWQLCCPGFKVKL